MLHRIRNLQLAMKVPKQLMQKLKARPQSPKKKTDVYKRQGGGLPVR